MTNEIRAAILLIVGSFMGVYANSIVGMIGSDYLTTFLIILIIVFAVFYGSGMEKRVVENYASWRRRRNNIILPPKIGIISDLGLDFRKDLFGWTDITPRTWLMDFREASRKHSFRSKVEFITTEKRLDSYVVVVNPYGSVYPESDLGNLSTMKKLLEYVKKGGIFVNVADIPCYWARSMLLDRTLDTTPPKLDLVATQGGIQAVTHRNFSMIPLMRILGIRIDNSEKVPALSKWQIGSTSIDVHRVIQVKDNIDSMIPIKKHNGMDFSPFVMLKYGNGDFMFCVTFQSASTYPNNALMKDLVCDKTISRVNERALGI